MLCVYYSTLHTYQSLFVLHIFLTLHITSSINLYWTLHSLTAVFDDNILYVVDSLFVSAAHILYLICSVLFICSMNTFLHIYFSIYVVHMPWYLFIYIFADYIFILLFIFRLFIVFVSTLLLHILNYICICFLYQYSIWYNTVRIILFCCMYYVYVCCTYTLFCCILLLSSALMF